jgi:hypothetical protein
MHADGGALTVLLPLFLDGFLCVGMDMGNLQSFLFYSMRHGGQIDGLHESFTESS